MPNSNELISKSNAIANGKPDANLSNDSNNLGGIPAEEYATQEWVKQYHEDKETTLKEGLEEKIQDTLDSAKGYADDLVKNQDFSAFAKTTDVKALEEKLNGEITECQTKCKENLDKVVEDVNTNFKDVGDTLKGLNQKIDDNTNNLNEKYDELFQSVSNGKQKVAEAITDKGVQTSATDSFDTMASNIRDINTSGGGNESGGGTDPNIVNTSDGTATEKDILLGRTAYARGQKLYGAHICGDINTVNTDDATAAAYDIALGKTAYVKGLKLTGTHIDNALDTSDATATPYDIKSGKTAYVNGKKIEGVLNVSDLSFNYDVDSVEKVYGTAIDFIAKKSAGARLAQHFDHKEHTANGVIISDSSGTPIGVIRFEYEGADSSIIQPETLKVVTYLLRDDGTDFNPYNRKEYSMEDLQIPVTETHSSQDIYMSISASKFYGDYGGYIMIFFNGLGEYYKRDGYVYKIKIEDVAADELNSAFYSYLTIDINSQMCANSSPSTKGIGTAYTGAVEGHEAWFNPFNKNIFATIHTTSRVYSMNWGMEIFKISDDDSIETSDEKIKKTDSVYLGEGRIRDISFLVGGRLICVTLVSGAFELLSLLESEWRVDWSKIISGEEYKNAVISYDAKFLYSITSNTLYSMDIDYDLGDINFVQIKNLSSLLSPNNQYGDTELYSYYVNSDATLLYLCETVWAYNTELQSSYNYKRTKVYSMDFSTDDIFTLIQTYDDFIPVIWDSNKDAMFDNTAIGYILYPVKDYSRLIGLMYQGEFYLKTDLTNLTALPENVEVGRTFIGKNGTVEIGTLQEHSTGGWSGNGREEGS